MRTSAFLFFSLSIFLSLAFSLPALSQPDPSDRTLFNTDVRIFNTSFNQTSVKISQAPCGFMAACAMIEDTSGESGLILSFSSDNGTTWIPLNSILVQNVKCIDYDIVAVGSTQADFYIYIATLINYNFDADTLILDSMDVRFNIFRMGLNGILQTVVTEIFNTANFPSSRMERGSSVSIVSDAGNPSPVSNPVSIAAFVDKNYTYFNIPPIIVNTIVEYGSPDGGQHFFRGVVDSSMAVYGTYMNVRSTYGKSASLPDGFLAVVYQDGDSTIPERKTYTRHTSGGFFNWSGPVNLDSLRPDANLHLNNVSIAAQAGTVDNDSSGCSIYVFADMPYQDQEFDHDVISFYTYNPNLNYWNTSLVAATADNEKQGAVSYDGINQRFVATYFDTTLGSLPSMAQTVNFNGNMPFDWNNVLSPNYCDTGIFFQYISNPHPFVTTDPITGLGRFAWIKKEFNPPFDFNTYAVFDVEEVNVGIATPASPTVTCSEWFPNPTKNNACLSLSIPLRENIFVNVLNLAGQIVLKTDAQAVGPGSTRLTISTKDLSPGIYTVSIFCGEIIFTRKLIIQ